MQVSIGQQVVQAVLIANFNNGKPLAANPSNWPVSATFAVEYMVHDRQFPQVKHEPSVDYFDDVSGLIRWLEAKREWIRGTDFDFSMTYSVYTWDWGPVLKYNKQM